MLNKGSKLRVAKEKPLYQQVLRKYFLPPFPLIPPPNPSSGSLGLPIAITDASAVDRFAADSPEE